MKILLLLVALSVTTTATYSQTFKISGVESPSDDFYENLAKLLGKNIVIKIYDNSTNITIDKQTYNLKQESNNIYIKVTKGHAVTSSIKLTINTIFNYITSIHVEMSINQTDDGKLIQWGEITAKRS